MTGNQIEAGCLYLVATPIGNLSDISARAERVLSGVDFIAAEDTRVTGKLLARLGIKKPLVSYYEHNKKTCGEVITARLSQGQSCALVTDAGTPGISDPGEDIVGKCAALGIKATAVPGPCAAIAALSVSGLPCARFVFEGFLGAAKSDRAKRLRELAGEERTIVFYEAPHKLLRTLEAMRDILGERDIAVVRELTKMNEQILRTTLSGALEYFTEHAPRGEFVLVVRGAGPKNKNDPAEGEADTEKLITQTKEFESAGMSRMDAIKATAKANGLTKSEVYAAVSKK